MLLSLAAVLMFCVVGFGQSKAEDQTNSDQQKVEKIIADYLKAMQADAKERDKFRSIV